MPPHTPGCCLQPLTTYLEDPSWGNQSSRWGHKPLKKNNKLLRLLRAQSITFNSSSKSLIIIHDYLLLDGCGKQSPSGQSQADLGNSVKATLLHKSGKPPKGQSGWFCPGHFWKQFKILPSFLLELQKISHIYMWNLRKSSSHKQRVEWWLPWARRWQKWRDISLRVQTFSYKLSKFWRSNARHGHYS